MGPGCGNKDTYAEHRGIEPRTGVIHGVQFSIYFRLRSSSPLCYRHILPSLRLMPRAAGPWGVEITQALDFMARELGLEFTFNHLISLYYSYFQKLGVVAMNSRGNVAMLSKSEDYRDCADLH